MECKLLEKPWGVHVCSAVLSTHVVEGITVSELYPVWCVEQNLSYDIES